MIEAKQIVAGGKKGNRREHDFYPTPKECTIVLFSISLVV
jgi:hypothetical protein